MAQKATKALATRNAAALNRIHLISLVIHLLFLGLRGVLWSGSVRLLLYGLVSLPAVAIEVFMELNSRPKYTPDGEVARAGDDLDARGLTDYLFDVLYWTWATIVVAALFGNRAWWMWVAVPVYSVYAAYKAFGGVKESLAGLSGAGKEGGAGPQSKRQAKLEKRGGQRVQYR